jgi:SAM-dependent methyltransferase
MSHRQDQEYLRSDQYRNPDNLNARIALHKQFSTNPYDFYLWVYDSLGLVLGESVLEIGCGPGSLWAENLDRLPPRSSITLADLSPGMIAQAQINLAGKREAFNYLVTDAQALPFGREQFDVVIANHMLYHVPDIARALSEIRRVLRDGGRFYAATNGEGHMRELDDLIDKFDPARPLPAGLTIDFTLENGQDLIGRSFGNVAMHRYEDGIVITSAAGSAGAEALAAYALSMGRGSYPDTRGLVQFVERELEERGPIHISKDVGLFEAQ